MTFYHQPRRCFISELLHIYIFPYVRMLIGFCFPTCWLDRLPVIANKLRIQPAIEILLPEYCYPYFYVSIHAELSKPSISIRFLISQPRLRASGWYYYQSYSDMCDHVFQIRQFWYCYPYNEFFIPIMYCYIIGIPEMLLLTFHSCPIPSCLSMVMTCDWLIVCFIAKTYAFSNHCDRDSLFNYC
jgi:hypothetical protein